MCTTLVLDRLGSTDLAEELLILGGGPLVPVSSWPHDPLNKELLMRNVLRTAITGAIVSGLTFLPATAGATPPSGVTGKILAQTTVGGKDYILREITVQPGGSTGWHYHDGTLYALVKRGTLTRTQSDCTTTETHPAGTTIVEPSGADHVHIGRNLGSTLIVLEVLYVNPAGSPLSQDAPDPGCDFQ